MKLEFCYDMSHNIKLGMISVHIFSRNKTFYKLKDETILFIKIDRIIPPPAKKVNYLIYGKKKDIYKKVLFLDRKIVRSP